MGVTGHLGHEGLWRPCVSPAGWAGPVGAGGRGVSKAAPRPQTLVRWCDSSPCKNDGRCWQTNAMYRCECHSGWTGLYCDVPSVSCEVAARQQGNCLGFSVPTGCPNSEVRGCAARGSPWGRETGPHAPPTACPAGINVTHLCRNGGLCMNAGNTHHCHCQAGYTGSYCEEQVDECSPSPCQNGATCTDYPGGYSCEVGARPWGGGVCVWPECHRGPGPGLGED